MIVMTGAGGQLGRLIAAELLAKVGPAGFAVTTRHPDKIADLTTRGVKAAQGDFDDPAGLAQAFRGAETLLLISGETPVEVRIRQQRAAIDAAKSAGVGRVVYTSFAGAGGTDPLDFATIHGDTERYLQDSGLAWTILRNGQYAENLAGAIGGARASGVLALPAGPAGAARVAYITRADIAAATAGALTGSGHAGKTYDLTGPTGLGYDEIATRLAAKFGKPVTYVDADPADYGKVLAGFGLPEFLIQALIRIHAAAAAGKMNPVSADAATLAGRPVEGIDAWIERTV